MNKRFFLKLLSSPVLFASVTSMVMMSHPAGASQTQTPNGTAIACTQSPHLAARKMVCQRVANNNNVVPAKQDIIVAQADPNQSQELEFTDEESDEAVKLFGCDCPPCINAVRAMRGLAPMQ